MDTTASYRGFELRRTARNVVEARAVSDEARAWCEATGLDPSPDGLIGEAERGYADARRAIDELLVGSDIVEESANGSAVGGKCPRCGFRLVPAGPHSEYPMCRRCEYEDYFIEAFRMRRERKPVIVKARYVGEYPEMRTVLVLARIEPPASSQSRPGAGCVPIRPFCGREMKQRRSGARSKTLRDIGTMAFRCSWEHSILLLPRSDGMAWL